MKFSELELNANVLDALDAMRFVKQRNSCCLY